MKHKKISTSNKFMKILVTFGLPWGVCCVLTVVVVYVVSTYKQQNAIPEWNPSILDFIPGQRTWLVLDVIDGDSIVIRYKGKMRAVQLLQVNAPDRGQDLFLESKNFLQGLILGKRVELVFPDEMQTQTDFFGRYLAYVKVGTIDVNQKLIQEGYAKIQENDEKIGQYERLKQLQTTAQAAQKNIWSSSATSQYID